MLVFYWILFFFVAFGAKALLAFVMIYLLLPGDGCCSHCDEPTLLLQPSRLVAWFCRVSWGRMQWRWCPRCGWEGLARTKHPTRFLPTRRRTRPVNDPPTVPEK